MKITYRNVETDRDWHSAHFCAKEYAREFPFETRGPDRPCVYSYTDGTQVDCYWTKTGALVAVLWDTNKEKQP